MGKKKNESIDITPEWYWVKGLHDARVTGAEAYEIPFNYNKYIEENGKTDRSVFILSVDAKGAIYDSDVKEIRLYNYKILSNNELVINDGIWWMGDSLTEENGSFVLEIEFYNYAELFTFKIKFERAEVDRD